MNTGFMHEGSKSGFGFPTSLLLDGHLRACSNNRGSGGRFIAVPVIVLVGVEYRPSFSCRRRIGISSSSLLDGGGLYSSCEVVEGLSGSNRDFEVAPRPLRESTLREMDMV